jgi:shikimate kinase
LVASAETIARRIQSDPSSPSRRPALTDRDQLDEIRELLQQRDPLYRECANLIVDTERRSPQQISIEIVRAAVPRWHTTTE